MKTRKWLTPGKLWLGIFGCWLLLLVGIPAQFGSPGVMQLVRLRNLLDTRKNQAEDLRTLLRRLETESQQLEKSKVVQQREIRRVLGYAAPDEIIFDFTGDPQLDRPQSQTNKVN
ncbi:MAG TPA: hypothetical protein VJB59_07015 [Bdellovibrionota bacterium]|nr:hypothetical protein [Bdellovibrionota bacterium]